MFDFFKRKTQTVFVSGVFYKEMCPENIHVFCEYEKVGKGRTYETPYDFIDAVRKLHRQGGYITKFEIVNF